jgi:hypothetical protein
VVTALDANSMLPAPRSPSPYENGRPHAPDRSRHIALKKPCHLPLKVTVLTRARTKTIVLTLGSTLPSLIYPLAGLPSASRR